MLIYQIQFAGSDFNQWEEKGEIDFEGFIQVINNFPWEEQLEIYNSKQKGASATISALNKNEDTALWISIGEDSRKRRFLIGHVFHKEVKGFLGLSKPKIKKWLDIYLLDDLTNAEQLFTLYFNNQTEELQKKLQLEDRYNSMEAAAH